MHLPIRTVSCLVLLVLSFQSAASELSAQLIVTAQGAELLRTWETNTGDDFSIVPVEVAERGVFLSAVVLFSGCEEDARGFCNAEVDFTAYGPDGTVYGAFTGQELWRDKPAPRPGHSQLGVGYMGIRIEPEDPPGTYKVVATARDRLSGDSASSEASFEVRPR